MHNSPDPDTTHAPDAIFVRDSGTPCPDPGDVQPSPPLPQSPAEAAAHCRTQLERLAAGECFVDEAWAAVEALENAARLEAREACANVAGDWGAYGVAAAIRALPLRVPR